jgi:hypothetical protein
MATSRKEITIDRSSAEVWDAVRDIGALHTRLVPGFVVDTKLEGEERVVTFGNGTVAREPILAVDDAERRLSWAALGGPARHYFAVLQVLPAERGTRVVWTSDFLPHELAPSIAGLQEEGLGVMKQALESSKRRAGQTTSA